MSELDRQPDNERYGAALARLRSDLATRAFLGLPTGTYCHTRLPEVVIKRRNPNESVSPESFEYAAAVKGIIVGEKRYGEKEND